MVYRSEWEMNEMQVKEKILFVGKRNDASNELYSDLSMKFHVSFSVAMVEALERSMEFFQPEVILFCMIGFVEDCTFLVEKLSRISAKTPVFIVCNEYQQKTYSAYFGASNFHVLLRPVTAQDVIDAYESIFGKVNKTEQTLERIAEEKGERESAEKKHVLIVDDNVMTLRTTKQMLESKYSVAVAASTAQAFMAIAKKRPDVILLDYEMPVVDGEAAIKMLYEDEEVNDIPVLFFTGTADKETVQKLLALNPAGYILKPPSEEQLVSLIEKALKKSS